MDEKYAIQIIFDEPDKKNQVSYLCFTWLTKRYFLAYDLLDCNLYFRFKETAVNEIKEWKEIITSDVEFLYDRRIVAMHIVRVKAEIAEYYSSNLLEGG